VLLYSIIWDHGIEPKNDHYAHWVDILGHVGHLNEDKNILNGRKCKPNSLVRSTMFSVYRIHRNMQIGKKTIEHVIEFKPK